MTSTKLCHKCGSIKSVEDFQRHKGRPDGRQSQCMPCLNSYALTDKRRAKARERYEQKSEEIKKYNAQFKKANRGYYNRLAKEAYARAEDKSRYRASCRNYQMKKRRACPPWVNKQEIAAVYKEASEMQKLTGFKYEVDHMVPINHPLVCGLHVPWNLDVQPATSNKMKSNNYWSDVL